MRLLVLGSAGQVGERLVAEALEQGHVVTAFTSHVSRAGALRPRLRTVTGDLRDPGAVSAALADREAVLWAPGDVPVLRETELSDAARTVTAALHAPIPVSRSSRYLNAYIDFSPRGFSANAPPIRSLPARWRRRSTCQPPSGLRRPSTRALSVSIALIA